MTILKKIWMNKQSRSSLFTSFLSLLLVINLLVATVQITAWFKNHLIIEHDVAVTNFQHTVQYKSGSNWVSVKAGDAIPITISGGSVQPVTVRIQHKGKSAVAIRVSAFGNYYNADTSTVLPLSSKGLWTLDSTSSSWGKLSNDDHLYYKNDYYQYSSQKYIADYTSTYYTDTFTVTATVDEISLHQDYKGELYIIVDAVQPDRFQELWGISALPFTLS